MKVEIKGGTLKQLENDNFVKRFIIQSGNVQKLSSLFVYATYEYLRYEVRINPDSVRQVDDFMIERKNKFEDWQLKLEDKIFERKNYYDICGRISEEEAEQEIREAYPDHIFE
ncbi:hypothetical protein KJ616_01705 [Patescibacteria group bacterium]|nr:hypothetical protein [Patescibacteria group bacterium]